MSTLHSKVYKSAWFAMCAVSALIVPWSPAQAGKAIEEHRAADPLGDVEIVNMSGSVEVDGWDRNEVAVSGTVDDAVQSVDVTSAANRTTIHVLSRGSERWSLGADARLVVHVPAKSSVTASMVSADFKITGVLGDTKLQSVSGNIVGDVSGNLRATTVSGDVRLAARTAKAIEVKTISGGIRLTGGGGEVDITTVSGNATVELGDVARGRFKSVSGNLTAELAVAPDGQIEGETVSGNVSLKFASAPAGEIDVQSFSGDITNCFGPKPTESRYGPGSRLSFKNGEGHARVQVNSKSGDVRLCVKGGANEHVSALSSARLAGLPRELPYVY